MIKEVSRKGLPGITMLVVLIAATLCTLAAVIHFGSEQQIGFMVISMLCLGFEGFLFAGLFKVNPNEAKVLQLFGKYTGSVSESGLRWANPFFSKTKVSQRVRNFETAKLKVNDQSGNPIEIGAVVVWRVVDTAEAVFEVDEFKNYVHVQSEAALRNLATGYVYDAHGDEDISLVGNTSQVSEQLRREIQDRLAKAGVEVIEARISHLAYAPEIAAAMLQRQQASAVVAARTKIVEGAVGMVELALAKLSEEEILEFDDERKAAMVSNLMVVLCSDRHTQPVVNTGTLHN